MTKTPEELTKDWKEGKLKSGLYWVKFKGKIVIAECTVFGDVSRPFEIETKTDFMIKISKVLAPVLTYDEYKAMQEQLNKEGTWYTEISYKKIKKENNQLRDLLRECKRHLYFQKKINNEVITLLTRINAALGESEE
jgi:hypothetical protein